MRSPTALTLAALTAASLLVGCESETDQTPAAATPGVGELPATYSFPSPFDPETESVEISGQIMRHALMAALTDRIGGLTERLDSGELVPAEGDVRADLDFYLRFDDDIGGDVAHPVATTPAPAQATFADISSGKDLLGKLAGNDPVGQYTDWQTSLVGWGAPGQLSPEGLVYTWIGALEAQAIARANGDVPVGPDGLPIAAVYVSPEGLDYQQLIAKFLGVAISFSQGADDYLDDDLEGKGILADNTAPGGDGVAYTALAHHWDEAFGYFGAARDYGDYTDAEIAGKGGREGWGPGGHDTDGDGAIDLQAEINFGHAVNAGKRDVGAVSGIDLTGEAWAGFLRGRAIIHAAKGPLDADAMAELKVARDQAVAAWEGALMATAIHYINAVLADMQAFDSADYNFLNHAKHFSELKGFAFAPQFNPRSPLSAADFARLHSLIGDRPVLPGDPAAASAYAASLTEARTLLGEAYGFAAEDVAAW